MPTPNTSAETTPQTHQIRPNAPLLEVMTQRWSTRNFDPDATVTHAELATILEAGRWAPSAYNAQPWRFIPTHRGTVLFDRVVSGLSGFNKTWAPRASVLIVNVAVERDEAGHEHPTADYDLGQAVAMMSLQAQSMGMHVHQMSGIDAKQIAEDFGLSANQHVVTVMAIGRYNTQDVPGDLVEKESAPRVREPLESLLLAPIDRQ